MDLENLLMRTEASFVLALKHHHQLPCGKARDVALQEASDLAQCIAALKSKIGDKTE